MAGVADGATAWQNLPVDTPMQRNRYFDACVAWLLDSSTCVESAADDSLDVCRSTDGGGERSSATAEEDVVVTHSGSDDVCAEGDRAIGYSEEAAQVALDPVCFCCGARASAHVTGNPFARARLVFTCGECFDACGGQRLV